MQKTIYRLILTALFVVATALCLCACSLQGAGSSGSFGTPNALTITMLDVLHGDAILLQDGKRNIMIDTGHNSVREQLLKKLDAQGIKKIDTIIVTHHDGDHIGNVLEIAAKYKTESIYDNGLVRTERKPSVLLAQALKEGKYKHRILKAGDTVKLTDNYWFEVLSPGDFLPEKMPKPIDNKSIVMKMHYHDFSMLFAGDIEKQAEAIIAERYGDKLKADVLKVAHHGSGAASIYSFISKVMPKYALISCGIPEVFHQPHPNTVGALKHLGAEVYSTQEHGNLKVVVDKEGYKVSFRK